MIADVAIIGGSFSGLSAALFLANSRRNIIVIDAGNPANAPAKQMHNLIGSEGVPPLVFLANARTQLKSFKNLQLKTAVVTRISYQDETNFKLETNRFNTHAKKIILATGIRHILPDIKNIAKYWAHNIFHCPYCFGPEFINQPLAIYCKSSNALKQVLLMRKWSNDFILLTDGENLLSNHDRRILNSLNVPIIEEQIRKFSGEPGKEIIIHFANNNKITRRGIFLHPQLQQNIPDLIKSLNLKCTTGGLLKTFQHLETNIKGIYAAGDAVCEIQKVPTAISSGSLAAFYVDNALSKLN